MEDVARACQAGSGCGGCHEVIEELLARETTARTDDARVWSISLPVPNAA